MSDVMLVFTWVGGCNSDRGELCKHPDPCSFFSGDAGRSLRFATNVTWALALTLFFDQDRDRYPGIIYILQQKTRAVPSQIPKDALRSACDRQPRRGQEYLLRRQ